MYRYDSWHMLILVLAYGVPPARHASIGTAMTMAAYAAIIAQTRLNVARICFCRWLLTNEVDPVVAQLINTDAWRNVDVAAGGEKVCVKIGLIQGVTIVSLLGDNAPTMRACAMNNRSGVPQMQMDVLVTI
jgi:hypothetical protein